MKKIFLFAMAALLSVGALTSCEDDYEDATSVHVYGESENPPLKGSDATNLVSAPVKMQQAQAGSQVITVNLADYDAKIQELMGMTLDEVVAGLNDGSVRFLLINPNRRLWDKTPANDGDNTWALSAGGLITTPEEAAVILKFDPSSKTVSFTLTDKAVAGIIPVTYGFVKTDDSAFSTNVRFQNNINVLDASVAEVAVTVPQGGYASAPIYFKDIAANIEYAFGETNLYNIAKGLDTEDPVYDLYVMKSDGSVNGGPGTYTANGAGYWMDQDANIVSYGADGYAMFAESFIYDEDTKDYYTDGGGINIGRLSNDTPASGTVLSFGLVLKKHNAAEDDKTLTINVTATFE